MGRGGKQSLGSNRRRRTRHSHRQRHSRKTPPPEGKSREEWARLGDAFRVEARIEIVRTPDALTVPVGALFRGQTGWSAFVIDENHARLRAVAVSRRSKAEAAVTSGLSGGERVVVFPPPVLRDGAMVEARDMEP